MTLRTIWADDSLSEIKVTIHHEAAPQSELPAATQQITHANIFSRLRKASQDDKELIELVREEFHTAGVQRYIEKNSDLWLSTAAALTQTGRISRKIAEIILTEAKHAIAILEKNRRFVFRKIRKKKLYLLLYILLAAALATSLGVSVHPAFFSLFVLPGIALLCETLSLRHCVLSSPMDIKPQANELKEFTIEEATAINKFQLNIPSREFDESGWAGNLAWLIKYESVVNAVLSLPDKINCAFLMGDHARLGNKSFLYCNFFKNPLLERKVIEEIFDFADTSRKQIRRPKAESEVNQDVTRSSSRATKTK